MISPVHIILAQAKAPPFVLTEDSVTRCIEDISWLSLITIYTYGSRLSIDTNARKLVATETPRIIHRLYDRLGDKEKTVVLHMILTQRREKIKASLSAAYTLDGMLIRYEYNGANWEFNSATQQYSIGSEEVEELKRYWRKKIYNKE